MIIVKERRMTGMINETRDRLAYSVDEISEQTTLSKAFLRNEIRAGHLKIKRFGARVCVLNADLQNYLKGEENEQK